MEGTTLKNEGNSSVHGHAPYYMTEDTLYTTSKLTVNKPMINIGESSTL
jgi:hypothetical protein